MPDDRPLSPGEYTVLGLLADAPQHGYELSRRWQSSVLADLLPAEQSVLYGHLRTLERRGLVEWEEVRVGNRPPRRIFSISEDGWGVLRPWLRAPVGRMREARLDLLLKIYLLRLLDPTREARLIREQIAVCEGYLAETEGRRDAADGFERVFWESKVTAAAATLTWLANLVPPEERRRRAS